MKYGQLRLAVKSTVDDTEDAGSCTIRPAVALRAGTCFEDRRPVVQNPLDHPFQVLAVDSRRWRTSNLGLVHLEVHLDRDLTFNRRFV